MFAFATHIFGLLIKSIVLLVYPYCSNCMFKIGIKFILSKAIKPLGLKGFQSEKKKYKGVERSIKVRFQGNRRL